MPALVSTRFLFLVGESLPLRKFSHVSHIRRGSVRFLSRIPRDANGPLTLASLGFREEREITRTSDDDKPDKVLGSSSTVEFPISKVKMMVRSTAVKALQAKESVDIEGASFSAQYKPDQLGSTVELPKSEVKLVRKAIPAKESVEIEDGAPVSSQYKPNQLGRRAAEFPQSKVKKVRGTLVKAKKSVEMIEDAPFSAQSFSELGLAPLLIERLKDEGFTTPTDVQSATIPTMLKKHDVVIQSYTGSGKTLAYLLPILSEIGPLKRTHCDASEEEVKRKADIQAVIVAPSRELGMQIFREAEKILGPMNKRVVQQLVGGASRTRQEEALKKNKPSIVVGTPGRIAEISAAGKLSTHDCRYLVLDEVDELLSFNFRESMHRILEHVGRKSGADRPGTKDALVKRPERQIVMVSATVPFPVIRAARSWGNDPLLVQAKKVTPIESLPPSGPIGTTSNSTPNSTQGAIQSLPPNLKHYYCVTKLQHKIDTLRKCVHALDAKSVIAFMNHSRQLKDVVFKLEARGVSAIELHGDLGKLGRSTTINKFKKGAVRVLVTNELSARGLDVPECDLVVNLDLPTDSIHYAHRAGRTGRLGRKGSVVTLCEEPQVFVVKKLQKQLDLAIEGCEFADGKLVVSEEEKKALVAARQ